MGPGPEVIKLEFILRLKIKHNDWLLVDTCLLTHVRKQPIIALYFEFETVLKFYNLGARFGSKRFDTPIVFLKDFFEKLIFEKSQYMKNYPACKELIHSKGGQYKSKSCCFFV